MSGCVINVKFLIWLLFPFGYENNYELQNIINTDNLKSLENLPSYKIASKAYDIDFLKQHDIDDNVIANINSRYYLVNGFTNIKNNNKTFSIYITF